MPTVEWNLQAWNVSYDWAKDGHEWSSAWGGSDAQWFGAILPRIHAFLPSDTILEIAPGFGRWTNHLKNHAGHLIVVDLAERCISACQERFASASNITYHVNDGRSLAMVPDNSLDFVFSFDSLVHAEADVIQAYLTQLADKLKPGGAGFVHHSNLGSYQRAFAFGEKIPAKARHLLLERGLIDQAHCRASSMTAALFEQYCDQAGLQCVGQELVNWGTTRLIDCFSLFTRKTASWARPNRIVENPHFMSQAAAIRRLSHVYAHSRTD